MRKNVLETNEIYHVLNKSIAGYEIFNTEEDFSRIIDVIRYYIRKNIEFKFSRYNELLTEGKDVKIDYNDGSEKLVEIIAYCIMPTHIHLVLRQLSENGISIFVSKALNSYTRYFNTKYHRKGPLWVGRFKNVLVKDEIQLLHLTRYIHLNPVSANLINAPDKWPVSSYNEYLGKINDANKICKFNDVLDIDPKAYSKFVRNRTSYQRELSKIKKIVID